MKLDDIKNQFSKGLLTKSEYIDAMYEQHSLLFDYSDFIKSTNLSSIEIKDDQVIATFRDSEIRFICIPGDKRLAPLDTLNFSEYEREELEMQYKLINPAALIVDIGANLGWYSMHIARHHPLCKVLAFEPIPRTFDYLNKNIELNRITNIKTYQTGMSDKPGEMELFFDPLLSVNASLKNVSGSADIQKVICQIDTLDSFCKTHQVHKVDFIKCDVEGAELFSLKGARQTLTSSQPIVFCEMLRKWSKKFDYHPNDIISYMKELNYTCLVIRKDKLEIMPVVTDETTDTNFIFLHNENHKSQFNDFVI